MYFNLYFTAKSQKIQEDWEKIIKIVILLTVSLFSMANFVQFMHQFWAAQPEKLDRTEGKWYNKTRKRKGNEKNKPNWKFIPDFRAGVYVGRLRSG